MSVYKVKSVEQKKSKQGKNYAVVFLTDTEGNEVKASVWDGHDTVKVGEDIEGEVYSSGDFTNFRITKHESHTYVKGAGGYRKMQIEEAQQKKAGNIREAQDYKQNGIRIAGAFRDATLISIEIMKREEMSLDEFKSLHKRVREWYLKEWQTTEDQPFF